MELDGNNQGMECLRLLNEIIADFDEVNIFITCVYVWWAIGFFQRKRLNLSAFGRRALYSN